MTEQIEAGMNLLGGPMMTELEYSRRRHQPQDRDTLRVAAAEMRSRGMSVRDIAAALGVNDSAVRQLLGERST
jgi:AcrR family transcriptional regulator